MSEFGEGVELHFVVMLARMQRVEVGNAVNAKHHCLAINHELLEPVLQCRLDDPRIAKTGPAFAFERTGH
jgi:hypothetical protein